MTEIRELDIQDYFSFYEWKNNSSLQLNLGYLFHVDVFPLWHITDVICKELVERRMISERNPLLIFFHELDFQRGFGCKAIHVKDLKALILSHLVLIKVISFRETSLPNALYAAMNRTERDMDPLTRSLSRTNMAMQNVRRFSVKRPFLRLLTQVADPHEVAPFSICTLHSLFLRYLAEKTERVGDIFLFHGDPIKRTLRMRGCHVTQTVSILQRELIASVPVIEE